MADLLPISKQDLDFLLTALKDCEVYYGNDQRWKLAGKLNRLHNKLQVNLNCYEEIDEEE